jgi:hypothetical protein
VAELQARLPVHRAALGPAVTPARVSAILTMLADRTRGVIQLDSDGARFDPRGAGAPEVASFNAALPLIRRFDPTITTAHEMPEVRAKLKRLADAMANAMEAAHRTGETLEPVLKETQGRLSSQSRSVLPDYIAIASAGPAALLETAADPVRRKEVAETIAAYEALAGAAAAAPRLWAMRDYLQATGLRWTYDADRDKDSKIAALESECQLLSSQLNPEVLLGEHHNLDALQARFQQFRWSYVQEYRVAHQRWRAEMKKLAEVVADARRHLDALHRLNSIRALGPAEGFELEPLTTGIERRIVCCDFDGPLAPEVTPRCPQCGYMLGSASPRAELNDLFKQIKAALGLKLAALSQSTIARLIREHDGAHRLEGFLKITQAAHTDALVRVLDDDLASYLGRLIDENLALADKDAVEPEERRGALVRRMSARRSKSNASKIRP